VPDRGLVILVLLATALSVVHTVDHAVRGDVRWPLTADSLGFIAVSAAIYGVIGVGLALYRRGRIGPRFWAVVAALGLALGWLGHFSPFTDQRPVDIAGAYRSAVGAWLALSTLFALMVVLGVAAVYAGWLTLRRPAGQ
jgi:hypothetical protein